MVEPNSETIFRGRTPTQGRPGSEGNGCERSPSPPPYVNHDDHSPSPTGPIVLDKRKVDGISALDDSTTGEMSDDAQPARGAAYNRGTRPPRRGPTIQTSADNAQRVPSSPSYPTALGHVHPQTGFAGQQYMIHSQSPVGPAHPPPANYSFQHYEASIMARNNYPQLVQPYSVPQGPQAMYAQQGRDPNSPPPSASHQFHPGNRFPSPQQFPYSANMYSSAGGYPSQYHGTYPQMYSPPGPESETIPPGQWLYLAHPAPPSQPYDPNHSPYQSPYNPSFSHPPITPSPPSIAVHSQPTSQSGAPTNPVFTQAQKSPSPLALPSNQSGGSSGSRPHSDNAPVRRPYHPNPPSHRSEWVMWVGNVPQDASHDELWRFFNQMGSPDSSDGNSPGVLSIHLISRSSCAFVNFESEPHLAAGIKRFNGRPLRPLDHRCPRLVCRVRRREDDLKAGVGGQRGMGIHKKWVKDQRARAAASSVDFSDTSSISDKLSSVSLSGDDGHLRRSRQSTGASNDSYASTNSSFLIRHFPKRYFILKSLSQDDVDLSVKVGMWATQKHNEGILDQAYRTSKEVYLIFSVNKSGEFYGYAKMVGPIRHGETQVSWASRSSVSSSSSQPASPTAVRDFAYEAHGPPPKAFFSPSDHRLVDDSPAPLSTSEIQLLAGNSMTSVAGHPQSAPAIMGQKHRSLSKITPGPSQSLDHMHALTHSQPKLEDDFKLDPDAPLKAVKNDSSSSSPSPISASTGSRSRKPSILGVLAEEEEKIPSSPGRAEGKGKEREVDGQVDGYVGGQVDGHAGRQQNLGAAERDVEWGESFRVEWIRTEKLHFYRTRHLRNPWNHDKEVKVSRDGTELEPNVGEKLLEEWDKLEATKDESP